MKTTITIPIILLLVGCSNQNKYKIEGEIEGDLNEDWIYMVKFYSAEPQVDSAQIVDNRFIFEGTADFPELYVIHNNPYSMIGHLDIFLEPAKMKAKIMVDDWTYGSKILGGKTNEIYNASIREKERDVVKKINRFDRLISNSDSIQGQRYQDSISIIMEDFKDLQLNYIFEHPDSPISPFLLAKFFASLPIDSAGFYLERFSPEIKRTSICTRLKSMYDMMKNYENSTL